MMVTVLDRLLLHKAAGTVGMVVFVTLCSGGDCQKHEGDQQRLGHVCYRGQQPASGLWENAVLSPKWRPPSTSSQLGEVRTTPRPARATG